MVDSEENEKFDLRVKGLMTFLVNAYVVLLLSFVLSSQHFVVHFKFNFVLCIIQIWRWQKNFQNMFFKFKSVIHFLRIFHLLLLEEDYCSINYMGNCYGWLK